MATGQDELEGHNFFMVPLSTTKKQLYSVFLWAWQDIFIVSHPKHDFWIELYPDLFVPHEFPMKWVSFALNPPITRFMSKWNELTYFFSKWLIPQQSLLSPLLYNYVFGHTRGTAYEKSIKEWLRRFRRYFISPPLPKRKPMTRHDLW